MKASTKREKIKLNQKYSEMNFWLSSLEDTRELFHAYDLELSDFLQKLESAVGESEIKEEKPETKELTVFKEEENSEKYEKKTYSKESFEDTEHAIDNKSCPPWMKKAFKAIALKTHPDKVLFRKDLSEDQKEELVKKYALAAEAVSNSSGISLLEIANSLGVELDLSPKEQISMIESKIKKIKSEITDHQNMVSWAWGENEGNLDIRVNLVVYTRGFLKKVPLNTDLIKSFIAKYENDESLFEKSAKRDRIIKRKVGNRPQPSISKLRKK